MNTPVEAVSSNFVCFFLVIISVIRAHLLITLFFFDVSAQCSQKLIRLSCFVFLFFYFSILFFVRKY